MDNLFKPEAWPIWMCIGVTVNAAFVNLSKQTIPNAITFPLILGGWLLAAAHSVGLYVADAGQGNLLAALAATGLAFLIFGPFWMIGAFGAGSVKLQMGIGSWLGAYYGLGPGVSACFWACVLANVGMLIQAVVMGRRHGNQMPTGIAQLIGLVGSVVGMELRLLPVLG